MIVDKLVDFISTCPHLEPLVNVTADYCNEDATSYCVETSPSSTVVQTFIDGSSERQLNFTFSSKEVMSDYDSINIENMNFYEKFSDWIEEQNNLRNLPELEGKLEAASIEVTSPGYVVQSEADRGRYCINLKLKYYKKK